MVAGVILAAGRSSRMGRPKALLPCGRAGDTFVSALVRALVAGGVSDVFVVGRPDDRVLQAELDRVRNPEGLPPRSEPDTDRSTGAASIYYVENPGADDGGQLSSLLAGLRLADRPGVAGVLVAPVDVPFVTGATVARLLAAFASTTAPIVRPVYRGAHGHPVLFARPLFAELRQADPTLGARAVVRAHAAAITEVEVDDAGVAMDVDTPEDYERLFGEPPATP
jgi:molybdenum cofactor cytidylyltransferase